jgi:hypothetical protein
MPFIGEAAENRARAPSDLDWSDSWQVEGPSGRSSSREPSGRRDPASGPHGAGHDVEELSARLAPPNLTAAAAVPYPFGAPPGQPGAAGEGALASMSSATLASGLVDATASPQTPRKRTPVLLIGLLLGAVAAGVGAFLGRDALTGGQEVTSPGPAAPPATDLPGQVNTAGPGVSATPSSAAPSTAPAETAEPTADPSATAGGRRPPRPPGTGRPKATASPTAAPTAPVSTKTADPFSERI